MNEDQWWWFYWIVFISLLSCYLPLQISVFLYFIYLNYLIPRMLCAKFRWHLFMGRFLMLFIFLLLVIISRLRNSVALHLNKLESISPKNVFAKIDWNSACSSLEEDFFKVVNILVFTIFAIISFWKRFEQTWISFFQWCTVLRLVNNSVVLGKKIKLWKVLRQTD